MRIPAARGRFSDAIVRETWRATVLAMIFALMLLACSSAYAGLFDVTAGRWARSAGVFAVATLAAMALAWLSAHREELIAG